MARTATPTFGQQVVAAVAAARRAGAPYAAGGHGAAERCRRLLESFAAFSVEKQVEEAKRGLAAHAYYCPAAGAAAIKEFEELLSFYAAVRR